MTSRPLKIAFVYDLEAFWPALEYSGRPGNDSDGDTAIDGICAGLRAAGYIVSRVDGIKTLVKYLASGQWPSSTLASRRLLLRSSSQDRDRTQRAIECSRHAAALRSYPLFAKPVAEHTSKGVLLSSKIKTPENLEKTISQLGALYHGQDILLETFLSGREITVGILGTGEDSRVIGANEYVYKKPKPSKDDADPVLVDFATDLIKGYDMDKNPHMDTVSADLSDPEVHGACQLALAAWKVLHCRDAGKIDTRYDKMEKGSVPHIMEVNPIPGMVPDWSDLALIARDNGLPYEVFLRQIVESALARTKNVLSPKRRTE